jgi:hypothetical protein
MSKCSRTVSFLDRRGSPGEPSATIHAPRRIVP